MHWNWRINIRVVRILRRRGKRRGGYLGELIEQDVQGSFEEGRGRIKTWRIYCSFQQELRNDSLFVIISSFIITQYKYWILLDFLIFFGLPLFTLTSFMIFFGRPLFTWTSSRIFFGRPLFTSTLGCALVFWGSSFLGLPLFFTPEISYWIVFCKTFFFLPLFFFSRLLFFNCFA